MERSAWDRIQQIYYEALPLARFERNTFVENACNSDPYLVREVSSLLKADDTAGDFLTSPMFEAGLRIISNEAVLQPNHFHIVTGDRLIGFMIDRRYFVEKELGRGGMGSVYLAHDVTLHNRVVVIKVLNKTSQMDPHVIRKFKQEVEALSRIDHPNVVSVLDTGELPDGNPFIAMQYVNGVPLRSEISSDGMDFERAASILKQIGEGLDDVHGKGIFHRDLKPENIMIQTLTGGAELVKIVDFGVARVKASLVAPSTVNQVVVGTVLYMSPEQLRGERVTAASDIFSMGIVAYEMLTGRRPFNPASGAQLLEMHRAGVPIEPIQLRTNLAVHAQSIILRALSFNPDDRFQKASDFGSDLSHALTNGVRTSPTIKSPAPNTGPLQPTVRDDSTDKLPRDRTKWSWQRKVVVAVAAMLVAVGTILGVSLYRMRGEISGHTAAPQRSFNYWLTVQKIRDGKPYQEPFQSSGQEIFENGYKFRVNVNSRDPGYLYIFNEGPPDADGISFTMLFPTPKSSSNLAGSQAVQTNWNTFGGEPGTENLWIVWSTGPVDQLESARTEASKNPIGALTEPNLVNSVKDFLVKQSEPKTITTREATTTHVRGERETLVKLTKLQHR